MFTAKRLPSFFFDLIVRLVTVVLACNKFRSDQLNSFLLSVARRIGGERFHDRCVRDSLERSKGGRFD